MTYIGENSDDEQNEILREIERDWLRQQPQFTYDFLIETFPDAIDDFGQKIQDLKSLRQAYLEKIHLLEMKFGCRPEKLYEELKRINAEIDFLMRLRIKKSLGSNSRKTKKFSYEDIDQARKVSIVSIAERCLGQLKKSGRNYSALCPFHQERTASFFVYPDTNSFHCFGCNASGDVITFVRRFFHYDFYQTINFLTQ